MNGRRVLAVMLGVSSVVAIVYQRGAVADIGVFAPVFPAAPGHQGADGGAASGGGGGGGAGSVDGGVAIHADPTTTSAAATSDAGSVTNGPPDGQIEGGTPLSVPPASAAPAASPPVGPAPGETGDTSETTPRRIPPGRGRIEGTVVDAKTGEALIEAQVTVLPQKKRVLTDIEGRFVVDVKPGRYDLRVFAELRPARRIAGIAVDLGKATRVDVVLGGDADEKIAVEELVVVAAADSATETVQLVRRQKSSTVSDAVSAEQIARTPDSNASEAVKRVVGAAIQDNRYVVIRGLGTRYSLALLNGVPLPSPDPDLPSAPLDLFPAALLANLTVAKTFTPDLPGNFAGGVLSIETRDFPTRFTLKLRIGGAADSVSTFRKVNSYEGGALDFIGYDDGTRALPQAIPGDRPARDAFFGADELTRMGQSFGNRWSLWRHTAAPGLAVGATVGDTVTVADRKLGYLATVNIGNRWTRQTAHQTLVGPRDPDGSYRPATLQQDIATGTQTAAIGALVNLGYALSPTHRLGLISIYMNNTESSAVESAGVENSGNVVDRLRFRFLQRQLQFDQLTGEHAFAGGRLLVNWQGHLAFTSQHEPDTRDLLRVQGGDGLYRIGRGVGAAERTFGDLTEVTAGAGADVSAPFKIIKLKAGGGVIVSPRESRVRRFHFEVRDPAVAALPSEEAFRPENIGPAIAFQEATTPADAFDATRRIYNAYVMGDLVRFEPLRVIGGARLDIATTSLTLGNSLGVNPTAIQHLDRTDRAILPALSAVYALSEHTNLRAGYGGTVARPHLRELSPAPYFDYVRARVTSGNPALTQTHIHNADLRWETFPSGLEVLAVSLFYKYFESPIERTAETAGDGQNVSFKNASSASEGGAELEARLGGARLSRRLEAFYLGANFSAIASRVRQQAASAPGGPAGPTTSRPLQGQSPYVVNAELGFHDSRTQLSLLYNLFGRRIAEVGTAGLGDLYEEPFHRLDATWNQRLRRGLAFKLSATNLLNQRVAFRQGASGDTRGVEIYGYRPGVAALAALEWSYDEAVANK